MSTIREEAIYEIKLKDSFSGPLAGMESKMDMFEGKLGSIGQTIAGVFGGNILADAAASIVSFATNAFTGIVQLGAEMEQTTISFETMLGSAEKAKRVMGDLRHFADVTPFSTDEIINAGKQMLAYQFKSEELTDRLRVMGDVAAGLNIPLNDLIYLFGTLKSQDVAHKIDITQFASRGIPIWKELERITGKSGEALQKMVSDNQITFGVIDQAFKNMTKDGSQFGGLMDKLSRSLSGRWSTFQSKIENFATSLGLKVIGPIGKLVEWASTQFDRLISLNWYGLFRVFEDMFNTWQDLWGIITDVLSMIIPVSEGFDAWASAVKGLSVSFRLLTFPMRMGVELIKVFVMAIKASGPILMKFSEMMANLYTGNFKGVSTAWNQMGNMFDKVKSDIATSMAEFGKREAEGWKEILFPTKAKEETGDEFKGSGFDYDKKGGAAGAGKEGKGAGVEKIQAGTRNVVVNINTLKLADSLVSNKADLSDARLQEQLQRMLLTAVNNVNLVAQ